MPAIRCPSCGLINPSSAVLCDCGCVLNESVDRKTMAAAQAANMAMHLERQERALDDLSQQAKARSGLSLVRSVLRLFG